MDKALFERLLYEEESPTLDFKKEQYRFVKATEEEKSELLKDMIGFANAWRRSEAYILIGVEEIRGARCNVVGIAQADHLDDHSLQQFINYLTNRPMHFHYEAFGFEGKQIGVIRIEQQARPIYLKRDYGKLEKEKIYVRRGTSTDPTKPASPEEVAQMGQMVAPQSAELAVEFCHIDRDDSLGPKISWDAEFCEMPSINKIPDLAVRRQQNPFGINPAGISSPGDRLNANYFRELALFEFVRRLVRPVRLLVQNVGHVMAGNVRCELEISAGIGVNVTDRLDLPQVPKRRSSIYNMPALHRIKLKPAFRKLPGGITIDKNEDRYRIEIDCGDLQPGRRVWSEVFYVGTGATGETDFAGRIYAAGLPEPKHFALTIVTNIRRIKMSLSELMQLPEPTDDEE